MSDDTSNDVCPQPLCNEHYPPRNPCGHLMTRAYAIAPAPQPTGTAIFGIHWGCQDCDEGGPPA